MVLDVARRGMLGACFGILFRSYRANPGESVPFLTLPIFLYKLKYDPSGGKGLEINTHLIFLALIFLVFNEKCFTSNNLTCFSLLN